jgi:hypothetical protein
MGCLIVLSIAGASALARAFGNIAALALFVELITSIAAIQLGSLFADRVAAMHRRP